MWVLQFLGRITHLVAANQRLVCFRPKGDTEPRRCVQAVPQTSVPFTVAPQRRILCRLATLEKFLRSFPHLKAADLNYNLFLASQPPLELEYQHAAFIWWTSVDLSFRRCLVTCPLPLATLREQLCKADGRNMSAMFVLTIHQ